MKRNQVISLGLGAALLATAGTAIAQRDPAYEAARSAGQVGEKVDGYLGVVGSPGAAVEALVRDINIKRKAAYTAKAQSTGSTIEDFAFTTGCNLIANTKPGEKYQAPGGAWQTRSAGPAQRDGRCV
jgi:uncharacterized protein YdbL (DUF1318 family)